MERKVVIFGDSILKPVVVNDASRYVVSKSVDWQEVEQKLNVKIDNRSRMGATIKHGYGYLTEYLKEESDIFAAVIEFGGNDCDYFWDEVARDKDITHLPKTGAEEFEDLLNKMLDLLTEKNIKPVLMTLPPISASKYYSWIISKGLNEENIMKHLHDVEIISRHQEYYSNIVKDTAIMRNIDLVDTRKNFLLRKDYIDLMCEDGIHPNAQGEQVIIKTFLDKYAI